MAAGRWSGPARHGKNARRDHHREPLAIGWGQAKRGGDVSVRGETVVAAFERERLNEGLARLHGQGFGPSARVLDGARGDLRGQLSRAGLPADLADRLVPAERRQATSLLVVHAPARGETVKGLLDRSGAYSIEVVLPGPPAATVDALFVEDPSTGSPAEFGA
jgi:hypothetical protein